MTKNMKNAEKQKCFLKLLRCPVNDLIPVTLIHSTVPREQGNHRTQCHAVQERRWGRVDFLRIVQRLCWEGPPMGEL